MRQCIQNNNRKGPILQSSFVFQAYHPLITIMNKNYVVPNMPVEELPEEYHYLRDLMEKEANDTRFQHRFPIKLRSLAITWPQK